MDILKLRELLASVQSGGCSVQEAMAALKHWPAEDLGFACLDHHRPLRTGFPEVVYGENKPASQIAAILERMLPHGHVVMATRVDAAKAAAVREALPPLEYHERARLLVGNPSPKTDKGRGTILVIAAGTSDIPIAEEALVTARALGNRVDALYDVGVAGIHRLFAHRDLLAAASVLIVVAGMEGALPSVVGGLVDKPVIGLPTSIGYGTGAGGLAALLGMLNSCAPGVAVVNIDNGFGAGCLAAAINRA
ncbi:MAG: nickel pincer cofactor biosynthesis protein LarB [Desulfobacteraceae bacterium]|nr:nickel pincer cofactor biosynthesis protein LarB [Desulfobacteraceae bacterium]